MSLSIKKQLDELIARSGGLEASQAGAANNPNVAANKMDNRGYGVLGKLMREERKRAEASTKMKKGGYVKKADGCCKKGKTKGRMV